MERGCHAGQKDRNILASENSSALPEAGRRLAAEGVLGAGRDQELNQPAGCMPSREESRL